MNARQTKGQHVDATSTQREEPMNGTRQGSARVRRTRTTLADGREIIYFDDSEPYLSGAKIRDMPDQRPLVVRASAGTMRLDARSGEWVWSPTTVRTATAGRAVSPVPDRRRHDGLSDPCP